MKRVFLLLMVLFQSKVYSQPISINETEIDIIISHLNFILDKEPILSNLNTFFFKIQKEEKTNAYSVAFADINMADEVPLHNVKCYKTGNRVFYFENDSNINIVRKNTGDIIDPQTIKSITDASFNQNSINDGVLHFPFLFLYKINNHRKANYKVYHPIETSPTKYWIVRGNGKETRIPILEFLDGNGLPNADYLNFLNRNQGSFRIRER